MSRFDFRFDDILADDFYPGSNQRRVDRHQTAEREQLTFLDFEKPRVFTVSGQEMEFFTIGQLAAALERKPVTIRKWEREGTLPRATFLAPNPTGDPRARRRLYSRAQAEGIVRIARECQVIGAVPVAVGKTSFTERAFALFKELREAK